MPDFRLYPIDTPDIITLDYLLTPSNLIDETMALETAAYIALMTDGQAPPDAQLPDPRSTDLRGWWGDLDAQQIWNGWPIGSLLWLLTRAKIVDNTARGGATVGKVITYTQACLQPFVMAELCSKVTSTAQQTGPQTIIGSSTLFRGPKNAIQLRYQACWSELFPSTASATS